jgi:hypothetical protein
MAYRSPPQIQPPAQSGIRERHSFECLRCASILAGAAPSSATKHAETCSFRFKGRDPSRLELFATLSARSELWPE